VTFSGKKEGGKGWRVSSFMSRLLATDHPKVMTDNLLNTATKKGL